MRLQTARIRRLPNPILGNIYWQFVRTPFHTKPESFCYAFFQFILLLRLHLLLFVFDVVYTILHAFERFSRLPFPNPFHFWNSKVRSPDLKTCFWRFLHVFWGCAEFHGTAARSRSILEDQPISWSCRHWIVVFSHSHAISTLTGWVLKDIWLPTKRRFLITRTLTTISIRRGSLLCVF